MNKKFFKAVISATLPVLLGYVSIGMAFGILLQDIGFNFLYAALMSIIIYGGSMQYVAIDILSGGINLVSVAVMSLVVQARHTVYGLSMLKKFEGMGKLKPYMIFSLTDETYALLASVKAPENTDPKLFCFFIALFNQIYWIAGSVIGSLIGGAFSFNTKGIDFAMTALFIVICTEQWLSYKTKLPAVAGAVCAFFSLLIFGGDNMLIPAVLAIILVLFVSRNKISVKLDIGQQAKEAAHNE